MKQICFRIGLALTLCTQTGLIAAPGTAPGTLLGQQSSGFTSSVAVDNHRDVVVAGGAKNPGTGQFDFTVAKFDRDGTPLWQQILNDGFAYSVAVDNHGDVVAGGSSDFTVAKFAR